MQLDAAEVVLADQRDEVRDRARRIEHRQLELDRALAGVDVGLRRILRRDHRVDRGELRHARRRRRPHRRRRRRRRSSLRRFSAARTRTAQSRSASAEVSTAVAAAGSSAVSASSAAVRATYSPSRCAGLERLGERRAAAFGALIVARPRAAAARTTGSSALRRAIRHSARRWWRRSSRAHRAPTGSRAGRRPSASPSAAPARARGPARRASLASAARTDQCASGSSPEIELMKVSTSVLARALSAAARADGHCAETRSISSSTAAGSRSCASAVIASSCRF